MAVKLRTGNTKEPVTADADARLYASIYGMDSYVTSIGKRCAASLSGANKLVVQDGCIVQNGRFIDLEGITEFTIPSGIQAQKRSNLCVIRTTKMPDGTDTSEAITLTGEATADGEPVDPEYNSGSLLDGNTVADFPLYRVVTDGINAKEPVALFNVMLPAAEAWDSISQAGKTAPTYLKAMTAPSQFSFDWLFIDNGWHFVVYIDGQQVRVL